MPIEIKELLIKAVVEDPSKKKVAPGGDNQGVGNQETIVEVCVERILEILKDAKER